MKRRKFHPYVKALIAKLASDAELRAAQADLRKSAVKSLTTQSGSTRIRLDAEKDLQLQISDDLKFILYMIDMHEVSA